MLKIGSMFCNMCAMQKAFKGALSEMNIENNLTFTIVDDDDSSSVYKALFDLDTISIDQALNQKLDVVDILLVGHQCFQDTSKQQLTQLIISKTKANWIIFETSFDYFLTNEHSESQQELCDFLASENYLMDFYPLNSKYFQTPLDKNQVIIIAHSSDDFPRWANNTSKIKMFNLGFDIKYEVSKCLSDILEDANSIDQTQNVDFIMSDDEIEEVYEIEKLISDNDHRNLQIYYTLCFDRLFFINDLCPPISEQGIPIIADRRIGSKVKHKKMFPNDPRDIDLFSNSLDFDTNETHTARTSFSIRRLTILECMRLYGFSDKDYELLESKGVSNDTIISLLIDSTHVNMINAIAKHILNYVNV